MATLNELRIVGGGLKPPPTEPVDVGASLVDAQATPRMLPAESDEGNHKDCPYKA